MSTSTPFLRPCWCGNTQLEPFSEHYRACRNCETLISMVDHGKDVSRVGDDEADLYGRDYWFGHMEHELGFVNIYERARVDLIDRCLFWLDTLLRFQRPPARILELGSAHGGFVALMRWAGFDARGLELSPEIVKLATQLFDVPISQGPIEDQPIPPGSLDLIAAMDVLEHLPDPVATLRHCVSRLAPGGQLLLQTPQYPERATLDQLKAEGHRFIELLKEREHLYLFSATSIQRIAAESGVPHVAFEPAVFSHYDMFLVMSAAPIVPLPAEARTPLTATASARLVQAVLDLYKANGEAKVAHATLAADVAFLKRFGEEEHSRRTEATAALNEVIADLTARLDHSEQDRADRLVVIERQGGEIGQLQQLWNDSGAVAKRLDELNRPTSPTPATVPAAKSDSR